MKAELQQVGMYQQLHLFEQPISQNHGATGKGGTESWFVRGTASFYGVKRKMSLGAKSDGEDLLSSKPQRAPAAGTIRQGLAVQGKMLPMIMEWFNKQGRV